MVEYKVYGCTWLSRLSTFNAEPNR